MFQVILAVVLGGGGLGTGGENKGSGGSGKRTHGVGGSKGNSGDKEIPGDTNRVRRSRFPKILLSGRDRRSIKG